jgi:hypothetical protein
LRKRRSFAASASHGVTPSFASAVGTRGELAALSALAVLALLCAGIVHAMPMQYRQMSARRQELTNAFAGVTMRCAAGTRTRLRHPTAGSACRVRLLSPHAPKDVLRLVTLCRSLARIKSAFAILRARLRLAPTHARAHALWCFHRGVPFELRNHEEAGDSQRTLLACNHETHLQHTNFRGVWLQTPRRQTGILSVGPTRSCANMPRPTHARAHLHAHARSLEGRRAFMVRAQGEGIVFS